MRLSRGAVSFFDVAGWTVQVFRRAPPRLVGAGFYAVSIRPCVKIGSAVDDLATEAVESRANALVVPLGKLVAVPDQIKLRVAKDVAAVLIKEVWHFSILFAPFGQRLGRPDASRKL